MPGPPSSTLRLWRRVGPLAAVELFSLPCEKIRRVDHLDLPRVGERLPQIMQMPRPYEQQHPFLGRLEKLHHVFPDSQITVVPILGHPFRPGWVLGVSQQGIVQIGPVVFQGAGWLVQEDEMIQKRGGL